MTTSFRRESAKIYPFPTRARPILDGQREEAKPTADVASPRVARTAFGSGWYHEAAVQEAERATKR